MTQAVTSAASAQPVAEGLFEQTSHGPRLIGSHCVSCGALYFPQSLSCRNPACGEKIVERTLLPERGTVYSYTIQRYQPPPLFRMDGWSPYAIGLIDLGNGLQVMGMLTDIALDDIEIGMAVRLVVDTLHADPERGNIQTFKFSPDRDRTSA